MVLPPNAVGHDPCCTSNNIEKPFWKGPTLTSVIPHTIIIAQRTRHPILKEPDGYDHGNPYKRIYGGPCDINITSKRPGNAGFYETEIRLDNICVTQDQSFQKKNWLDLLARVSPVVFSHLRKSLALGQCRVSEIHLALDLPLGRGFLDLLQDNEVFKLKAEWRCQSTNKRTWVLMQRRAKTAASRQFIAFYDKTLHLAERKGVRASPGVIRIEQRLRPNQKTWSTARLGFSQLFDLTPAWQKDYELMFSPYGPRHLDWRQSSSLKDSRRNITPFDFCTVDLRQLWMRFFFSLFPKRRRQQIKGIIPTPPGLRPWKIVWRHMTPSLIEVPGEVV